MNVFTVIGIIGISMVIVTMLITFAMLRLSQAVTTVATEIEEEKNNYRANQTLGHRITLADNTQQQFQDARVEAAKRAASLPRGANMRIGHLGQANLRTASKNLKNDPVSAFKIATHQGWRGLGELEKYQVGMGGAAAAPAAAAAPRVKRKLVPGQDYAWIEITDDMEPTERRRARIANAKAKSAAMKELKASGADTVAAPAPAAGAPQRAPAAPAQPSAADLGIAEPDLIEITDDMDPNAVRKARIANAKATSAYKKALKAAGIDPSAPDAAAQAAAAAPAAPAAQQAPAAPAQPSAADVGIDEPDLIEITDDMGADEVRKARIANAKAMSAYKKALKAAGIDPSTVGQQAPAPEPQAAAAAPQPAQPAAAPAADAPPPPDLIEITDDMGADEVRQARIANAKAVSAYKKELKAAGIDPKTVDI